MAILISITSLTIAFSNVVVDAIVCIQSRKDPVHGSQDLMSLAWIANGIGGVLGCLLGGFLTEKLHPKYSYLIFSIMGLILVASGINLSANAERVEQVVEEGEEQGEQMKRNLKQVFGAIMMPEIYLVLLYFILNGFLSPGFGQFSYFFMLNTAHITKFQFAMFGLISRACHVVGSVFYKNYMKDTETRTIIFYATVVGVISSFIHFCFAMRWNLRIGVSDIIFIIFTDVVFGCLALAMSVLPCMSLFAKIIPPGIEGTIFALLTGIWNFSDGVISPMMGNFINYKFINVTAKDLSHYYNLQAIALVFSFTSFLIVPLIPMHKDIERYKREREEKNPLPDDHETNVLLEKDEDDNTEDSARTPTTASKE